MKTLRAKLFVSVGTILLLVALISYLLPEIFIKRDINKASVFVNEYVGGVQTKLKKTASILLQGQLEEKKESLAGLTTVVRSIQDQDLSPWVLASSIAAYSPDIRFVQVDSVLLTPWQAQAMEGRLEDESHVQVGDQVFKAEKLDEKNYLLSGEGQAIDGNKTLAWVQKVEMTQRLAAHMADSPVGIFRLSEQKEGVVLFSRDLFSKPFVFEEKSESFVFVRENEIDQVNFVQRDSQKVWIGFSFSEIAQKMAALLGKPVIFTYQDHCLGFLPSGKSFDPGQATEEAHYTIAADPFSLTILTTEDEAASLTHFFTQLREGLIRKISLNQLATVVLSLIVALILLGRISKRITRPIADLASASTDISQGKYDDVALPNVENREDEVTTLVHSFENMVVALRDREKIRGVLNKVVSKEIAEEILKKKIELGGEERRVTMLFSDIRGFTHLSEGFSPSVVIAKLNEYMTRMCRLIDQTHGVVDKFVGDEIMALYGAPLELENQALHAIEGALLMLEALKEWNLELQQKGKLIFEVGMGIHTGVVFSGNMGAENRLNYTVIGANVNLAARLCTAAKPMQILISEETRNEKDVEDYFVLRQLEPLHLKGIEKPVTVYEVLSRKKDLGVNSKI